MNVSHTRKIAFEILLRVETQMGFSDELLHSDRTNNLEERDQALVFELVLGCLRRQGELDYRIAQLSSRSLAQLDVEVRIALRLGCYQLYFLDRVPAHAAVSESVELVRLARKRSATGLVNAVLRRIAEDVEKLNFSGENHPRWLVKKWKDHFGEKTASALMGANLETAKTYLRLNTRFSTVETIELLRQEGIETNPTEIPHCLLVVSGKATRSRCYEQGRVHIQDISSQMVVPHLGLRPGMSFLDVCAAPGGKANQALELLLNKEGNLEAPAIACDLHLHRFRRMKEVTKRQFHCVTTDALHPLPFNRLFDRILVDAPCSGTGTLVRNPEIKWRLTSDDLSHLQSRQQRILSNALTLLVPGGVLVYSTCSIEPEENHQVIHNVLNKSNLLAIDCLERLPGRDAGDGFFVCKISQVE
ncbi:MAG: 16S rRNA (cytosine(967)-C(5))-methyltransferase [Solibacterales bacterium]|nr:16S rRNA (cytosine(967)-C(5))-methyltransferase [Bryobacterales bacterium]|tara:strand:+ start:7895 stop:9145 length:1251 start_codon:yes stop_codon:yes gene_type:complete